MTFCDLLAHVYEALLQVTGHSGWYRVQVVVQCTHVPASVHKFRSQPDCLADTDLELDDLERLSPVFPVKGAELFHEHTGTRLLKGQGKLNMQIISKSVLRLFTKSNQN